MSLFTVAPPIPAEAPVTSATLFIAHFPSLVYRIVDSGILSIVGWNNREKGSEKESGCRRDCFGQAHCDRAGGAAAVHAVRVSKDFHRRYCRGCASSQAHGIPAL